MTPVSDPNDRWPLKLKALLTVMFIRTTTTDTSCQHVSWSTDSQLAKPLEGIGGHSRNSQLWEPLESPCGWLATWFGAPPFPPPSPSQLAESQSIRWPRRMLLHHAALMIPPNYTAVAMSPPECRKLCRGWHRIQQKYCVPMFGISCAPSMPFAPPRQTSASIVCSLALKKSCPCSGHLGILIEN
jgi:hypothetical protein